MYITKREQYPKGAFKNTKLNGTMLNTTAAEVPNATAKIVKRLTKDICLKQDTSIPSDVKDKDSIAICSKVNDNIFVTFPNQYGTKHKTTVEHIILILVSITGWYLLIKGTTAINAATQRIFIFRF